MMDNNNTNRNNEETMQNGVFENMESYQAHASSQQGMQREANTEGASGQTGSAYTGGGASGNVIYNADGSVAYGADENAARHGNGGTANPTGSTAGNTAGGESAAQNGGYDGYGTYGGTYGNGQGGTAGQNRTAGNYYAGSGNAGSNSYNGGNNGYYGGVYGAGGGNGANGGDGGNGGNVGAGGGDNAGGSKKNSRYEKKPAKKYRAAKWIAAAMAGVLLVGGAAGGGIYVGSRLAGDRQPAVEQGQNPAGQEDPNKGSEDLNTGTTIGSTDTNSGVETTASTSDVSQVVKNVMPSIVAINCTSEYVANFWGQQYTQEAQGSGSGIIIGQNSEEVLIVTNNHVVASNQNARNESIEVVFDDDSSAPATIKGTEEGSDLAVISVKLSDLSEETLSHIKIATLGDSEALEVGQMAIAIGNALGYGQSTTVGWISALEREVATEDYTMSLIQTDAAINPGNSGGALLNIKGEVIGINSAKYSDESVEGMGFAIPISDAIPIINDLMNREEIPEEEQAYLGIVGQDVTNAHNERYGMPIGVYVYQVSADSPAEKAGLKMGNIITGFNGRKISAMSDLQRILGTYRAGEEVTMTIQVFDEGSYTEDTLHVTLGYKNR